METTADHSSSSATEHNVNQEAPPLAAIEDQVFHSYLDTIECAYHYGHIDEACALRLIAKTIRERLIRAKQDIDPARAMPEIQTAKRAQFTKPTVSMINSHPRRHATV